MSGLTETFHDSPGSFHQENKPAPKRSKAGLAFASLHPARSLKKLIFLRLLLRCSLLSTGLAFDWGDLLPHHQGENRCCRSHNRSNLRRSKVQTKAKAESERGLKGSQDYSWFLSKHDASPFNYQVGELPDLSAGGGISRL
jgi:hypothetical protein